MGDSDTEFIKRLNGCLPKEKRRTLPTGRKPRHSTAPPDTLATLRALSDGGYTQKITNAIDGDDQAAWDLFLDPELLRRTHAVLIRKRATTLRILQEPRQGTSGQKRNQRIRRFLDALEGRIQQVEVLVGDDVVESQRRTIRKFAAAIRAHRDAANAGGVEPEPWDERLWRVLDQTDATGT